MNEKVYPLLHDDNAERAVVGGILLKNSAVSEVLTLLNADGGDFYHTGHRLVFQVILSLIDKGSAADLITVCDELRNRGWLDKVGGVVFVADVADGAISAANIHGHAEIVKNYAIRRNIISEASKVIEAASSPMSEAAEVLAQTQRSILSLSSLQKEKNSTQDSLNLIKQTINEIEQKHERGDVLNGIATGFTDLDNILLGLVSSNLIIIAGRPAMGKSALAFFIAQHVAFELGKCVAYFSLEMPGKSLMTRALAARTGIDSRQLQRGLVGDNQWSKVMNAASAISDKPLFIDDDPDITPMELRAKARRLKAEHGLDLLVVDYIQLMRTPGRYDTREQAVAEISRTLKAIARELEIPVIGLSQLNRQVDGRTNRRPLLSDLRESGAIEQDADVIAFIYRDEVYNKSDDNPERGKAEIEIAKHRNGPTGRLKVWFDTKTQSFRDMQHG